jgi:1-acyl-sn-glycerol-3-phosphate acyltransferase
LRSLGKAEVAGATPVRGCSSIVIVLNASVFSFSMHSMQIAQQIARNNVVYMTSCYIVSRAHHAYHNLQFEGALNIPRTGPALIVPKHQSMEDIIVEGVYLMETSGRYGNWIMRSSLRPQLFLKMLGGIPIDRPKDLKKIKDKAERRRVHDKADERNGHAREYVQYLWQQNEIVINHAEGTRSPGKMLPIHSEYFDLAREVEAAYGIKIPIIPMGIIYPRFRYPRSKVILRAGAPLDVQMSNIEMVVANEIRELSGI